MKTIVQSPKRTVDLRSINRQIVLRCLYFDGPMSRLEVSQHSTLSVATVTNLVTELLKEEIVIETGQVESEGGRPRTILAVNPDYGCFVGVDLGETHVQLDLFDLTLRRKNTVRSLVLPGENSPQDYVDRIVNGLDELLSRAGVIPEDVLGMGIGLPGMVERSGARTVSSPLWKWQNVAFGELLEAKLSVPIFLDNGAKAMTLAELWFGAGRGHKNLITILLGTGIGSGIITEGALYRGPTNSAGELGHTIIILDGRPCRCGSYGCIEAYAGAPGIITTLREIAPDSPLLHADGKSDNQLTVLNNLARGVGEGFPEALETLHVTARYLGASIASLVNLFNPEIIVVGGWAGLQIGEAMLPDLREFLHRYALPMSREVVQIELSQLGQTAICMGAACLSLEQFLSGDIRALRKENL